MSEKIEMSKEDLMALLVATSKASCGFDNIADEQELWEFHCCDYNEPLYKIAKQVKDVDFEDERYNSFIKELISVGDGYYIKGEG